MIFKREMSLFFISVLKSISQIMLIENPVVGLIFLFSVGYYSFISSLALLLGAIVGVIFGQYYFKNREQTSKGLYGYNSALSALAITIFSDLSVWYVVSALSASMTVYLQYIIVPWFEKRQLPILTFPFVVISWGGILVINCLHWNSVEQGTIFQPQSVIQGFIYTFTLPFSQIFLSESYQGGALIILSVLLASWKLFFKAYSSVILCAMIWYFLGAEMQFFYQGLFGFNAVLVGIALALLLPSGHFWFVIPFASLFCVLLHSVLAMILAQWQLPVLTFPFILTTWLILWVNWRYREVKY